MKLKRSKIAILALAVAAIIALTFLIMVYNKTIMLNNPSKNTYPVRGIDVSSYQGEIDWNVIANQDISFAFIKATEGSTYEDKFYKQNFVNATKTNLRVGAYHFFSYDSSGELQADNFISVVSKTNNMLPPVVDIEFYGDKEKNLPDKQKVQNELRILLDKLEENYKMKPIIYATGKSYRLYIASDFDDYDIWIRNVIWKPTLGDKDWTFWQYSDREVIAGYQGKEKYIDMNVYNGSLEEFENY